VALLEVLADRPEGQAGEGASMSEFALQLSPAYEARERREADYYPTPAWCTRALLRHCPPPCWARLIEPAAGEGAIVRELVDAGRRPWRAIELREECREALKQAGPEEVIIGDWRRLAPTAQPAPREVLAVVGNPPFSLAEEFVWSCLRAAPWVALLLPLGFLASRERWALFSAHPVRRLIVLSRRPSFTGDGKTDCADYAWFVWGCRQRGISWAHPEEE